MSRRNGSRRTPVIGSKPPGVEPPDVSQYRPAPAETSIQSAQSFPMPVQRSPRDSRNERSKLYPVSSRVLSTSIIVGVEQSEVHVDGSVPADVALNGTGRIGDTRRPKHAFIFLCPLLGYGVDAFRSVQVDPQPRRRYVVCSGLQRNFSVSLHRFWRVSTVLKAAFTFAFRSAAFVVVKSTDAAAWLDALKAANVSIEPLLHNQRLWSRLLQGFSGVRLRNNGARRLHEREKELVRMFYVLGQPPEQTPHSLFARAVQSKRASFRVPIPGKGPAPLNSSHQPHQACAGAGRMSWTPRQSATTRTTRRISDSFAMEREAGPPSRHCPGVPDGGAAGCNGVKMFSTRPAYSSPGLPFLITRLRGGWRDGQNSSTSSCRSPIA